MSLTELRWQMLGIALLAAAAGLQARLSSGMPSLSTVRVTADSALEDLGFLGLGLRRQAADVHFIRLLEYYGTPEQAVEEEKLEQGGGNYPQLYTRALRMLELDPYFRYGASYAAGALAYNLGRPNEAIGLLKHALEYDPQAWQYHLYLAAIAYKKDQEFGKLVEVLEPALRDPECPALLKSIVAGVYVKLGQKDKALALYADIAENSKDPDFRRVARERNEKLTRRP